MNRNKFRYLVTVLTFLTLGYMFSGGDCGTDNEDTPPATSVAAPTNMKVSLDQASGSYARVSWSHSADQTRSDFAGYHVVTYEVDSTGNVLSTFEAVDVPKTATFQMVNSLDREIRYRTYVTAKLNNNVKSDSVSTIIYAAVISNTGIIDEYQATGTAKSGYGWNAEIGIYGNQYEFVSANFDRIDMHVRDEGGLKFFSPDTKGGSRTTLFTLIGADQAAFDQAEMLEEPTQTSVALVANNVYLLKLESNHYVKVWVKQIQAVTGGFDQVSFTWKVQPVAGLRVLKH